MTKKAKIYNGEKTVSPKGIVSKLDSYMKKGAIRTVSNTVYKNKPQIA